MPGHKSFIEGAKSAAESAANAASESAKKGAGDAFSGFKQTPLGRISPANITIEQIENFRRKNLREGGEGELTIPPDLLQRQKEIEEAIAKAKGQAIEREDELRGNLFRQAESSGQAIDAQVAALSEQLGFNAGQFRRQIGASQASRGLLRSGFTGQQIGENFLAEAQAKAGVTSRAEAQKRAIESGVERAQRGVASQREVLENKLRSAQLSATSLEQFEAQKATINAEFDRFISDLEIGSGDKDFLKGLLGGLAPLAGAGAGQQLGRGSPDVGGGLQFGTGEQEIAGAPFTGGGSSQFV